MALRFRNPETMLASLPSMFFPWQTRPPDQPEYNVLHDISTPASMVHAFGGTHGDQPWNEQERALWSPLAAQYRHTYASRWNLKETNVSSFTSRQLTTEHQGIGRTFPDGSSQSYLLQCCFKTFWVLMLLGYRIYISLRKCSQFYCEHIHIWNLQLVNFIWSERAEKSPWGPVPLTLETARFI